MANYVGVATAATVLIMPNPYSASLDQNTSAPANTLGMDSRVFSYGTRAPGAGFSTATLGRVGTRFDGFCGEIFEKVLVIPRTKALGFLVDAVDFRAEVWNTHLRMAIPLTGLSVAGDGGTVVTGLASGTYFPSQSQIYALTVPGQGTATISDTVTWTFTGVSGTDLTITGTRVAPFPFSPDWSEAFVETMSWSTSILTGYIGAEQRAALRAEPRGSVSYRVLTMSEVEDEALGSLVYSRQGLLLGVPVWPEKAQLLADLAVGSSTIISDTACRDSLERAAFVMLWRDFETWEVLGISSVSSGTIATLSPSTKGWAAGTWVVPLRLARLLSDQSLPRPTNWATGATFTFSCEPAI